VLTSSDLRADEQHESGKENARAPADCDESQNFHAADAVESRIANDIDGAAKPGNNGAPIKPKIIARGTWIVLSPLCCISSLLTTVKSTT
jgi:hypothetical protein